MRRPIPTRAPSRAQASHFPAAVGSHLGSRFLEQLSDTIVFPLWATLMLTAILPVPQLMHRTIGCRPTLRAVEHSRPTRALLQSSIVARAAADARSLETVIERGALTLCASPDALPFTSKNGPVPGFQIELGEKIAEQLGVKLTREWVVSAIQYRRADCDLVLDVIARKDTPPAGGVQVSRPYHRSGVVLAGRSDSPASSDRKDRLPPG